MKHLKISCQKHKIDSLLLSFRCMTNYMKVVHCYMLISLNKCKCLRICLKKSLWWKTLLLKRQMLYVHNGIASMRQFQCVPTKYVTENKEENYLEIYIFQVSCPLSLPLFNIPTANQYQNSCHSIANCLYLQDSYISKFDFMNYLYANLVVAWL